MTANHNLTWKKTQSKLLRGYFSETHALVDSNTPSLKELIFPIWNTHLSLKIVCVWWSFPSKPIANIGSGNQIFGWDCMTAGKLKLYSENRLTSVQELACKCRFLFYSSPDPYLWWQVARVITSWTGTTENQMVGFTCTLLASEQRHQKCETSLQLYF